MIHTPGYYLKQSSTRANFHQVQTMSYLKLYLQHLQQKSLYISKYLAVASFKLKNSLPYTGVVALQNIPSNHILARVPRSLILNTYVAFYSQLHQVFLKQWKFFNVQDYSEDRILSTYIMWVYCNQVESPFLQMINNFSKDIDILTFWTEEQLLQLEDKELFKRTKENQASFMSQFLELKSILEKYQQVFGPKCLDMEAYKFAYIHVTSRAFSKYFKYYSFIPFVQFFNHNISDVSYQFQAEGHLQINHERFVSEEQIRSIATSQESADYEAQETLEDYDYSNVRMYKTTFGKLPLEQPDPQELTLVQTRLKQIEAWLFFYVDWKDPFSFVFVGQVFQQLKIIMKNFSYGLKDKQNTFQDIKILWARLNEYKLLMVQYFSNTRPKIIIVVDLKLLDQAKFGQHRIPEPLLQKYPKASPFTTPWEQEEQTDVIFFTDVKDNFRKLDQVYFCYGRLCNRLLLERYGFALHNNKYDKTYLKISIIPILQQYPEFNIQYQANTLPKLKNFKLKRTLFCTDLVVFLRIQRWRINSHRTQNIFNVFDVDLELELMEEMREFLMAGLSEFKKSKEEYEKSLQDDSKNYRSYWATLYKLGRMEIFNTQMRLSRIVTKILLRLKEQIPFDQSVNEMTVEDGTQVQKEVNRYMLRNYINMLRQFSN